jgi:NADH-quinone oxidoreductase subunit F
LSALGTAQKRARRKWEDLRASPVPVIYFGSASCGLAAGINPIKEAVMDSLDELNIEAQFVDVGCIGMCCFEPMLYIQKDGKPPICYGELTPEVIPGLMKDFLMEGNPRADVALGSFEGDGCPGCSTIPC